MLIRYSAVVVVLLSLAGLSGAQAPERVPPPWVSLESVNRVSRAERQLGYQVEQLRREIDRNLDGLAWRDLTQRADDALTSLAALDDSLAAGVPRADLYVNTAAAEAKVRALLRDVGAHTADRPALEAAALRVLDAQAQLGGVVSKDVVPPEWAPDLVAQEADNLVYHARALERAGRYSLSAVSGRRQLQDDLHALTDATEYFRGSVTDGAGRARLVRDFLPVEEAWARVAPAVKGLTRDERLSVMPRASSVDDAVLKLHRRLGLKGTTARLDAAPEPERVPTGLGQTTGELRPLAAPAKEEVEPTRVRRGWPPRIRLPAEP